jgi:RimJ/RimL family protein N-acetyltransferase
VDVAMGSAAKTVAEARQLLAKRPDCQLHLDTSQMVGLMDAADLLIGCGGMTSWEACCLGLPSVIVPVVDNQLPAARTLKAGGASLELAKESRQDPEAWRRLLSSLVQPGDDKLASLSCMAASLCSGEGASRVADVLESRLRPIATPDAQKLFQWRNAPRIRASSHSQEPLVWESHIKWVGRCLHRTDGLWSIYSEGGRDVGHINAIEDAPAHWRWSFYIGDEHAAHGAGTRMTASFLGKLFIGHSAVVVCAEVLRSNGRSIQLHSRLGFQRADSGLDDSSTAAGTPAPERAGVAGEGSNTGVPAEGATSGVGAEGAMVAEEGATGGSGADALGFVKFEITRRASVEHHRLLHPSTASHCLSTAIHCLPLPFTVSPFLPPPSTAVYS